jgi:alpha-beta hydrolase superfamily lysophospholipase
LTFDAFYHYNGFVKKNFSTFIRGGDIICCAMSLNKLFYSVASLLLFFAAFIFLCRVFITPELIYPHRIDSLYVKYEVERSVNNLTGKNVQAFYNPSSLGMKYENFNIKTADGILLYGWYIASDEPEANTLLIIHDLSESKINYLNFIKQMNDRGLNVCALDMRGHGNSEGDAFIPGTAMLCDMKIIFDSLFKKPETTHVAVFGVGIGTAAAVQSASIDGLGDALILQSPFTNFADYVEDYSKRKWGSMAFILHSVLERELEERLQYELTGLDLSETIKYVDTPTLFICGSNDEIIPPRNAYSMYDSSGAKEKNLILVKNAKHNTIEQNGGEEYYNKIAEFILNAIPKKPKDTRFKKLAIKE